jgi:hypothetical protein
MARPKLNQLKKWKEEAISVMPPMQEIGEEIGVGFGQTIHDKILPELMPCSLLPCPFCANSARLVKEDSGNGILFQHIECWGCGARGPVTTVVSGDRRCCNRWNTRANTATMAPPTDDTKNL